MLEVTMDKSYYSEIFAKQREEQLKEFQRANHVWLCSDSILHQHRWRFTAWICRHTKYYLQYIP